MSSQGWTLPLFLGLVAALGACSGEITTTDKAEEPGILDAFSVAGVVPDAGPGAGGTQLMLTGTGFTEGTAVTLGSSACGALTMISSTEITCITAGGDPGEVGLTLTRSEDGATASAAFTYVDDGGTDDGGTDDGGTDDGGTDEGTGDDGGTDDTGTGGGTGDDGGTDDTGTGGGDGTDGTDDTGTVSNPVDYCHLQWPCTTSASAGASTEGLYAWVYQDGVTQGAGEGAGLTVQFGVGPGGGDPSDGTWSWESATYNTDKDGLSSGDLANDEFTGTVTAPSASGDYDVCARVSIDGGSSWTYCDHGGDSCGGDGTNDGYSASDSTALTVP